MKFNLRRTALALTTACALLLVTAAPAAAVGVFPVTITSGTITLTKTGVTTRVISLTPDPTSGCASSGTTVTLNKTTSTTSTPTGTVDVDIVNTGKFFFGGTTAADHFIAVITGGTTVALGSAGTYDNTPVAPNPDTISSVTLRLNIKIYTGGSTSCTPGTTALCTWNVTVHLTGTFTATGDVAHPVSSNTATLNGNSTGPITIGGACAAPFTTYTGSNVAIAGLVVHF